MVHKVVEQKSVPIGLRLRPSLKAKLDEIAARERRPLAQLLGLVLEEYADEHAPTAERAPAARTYRR